MFIEILRCALSYIYFAVLCYACHTEHKIIGYDKPQMHFFVIKRSTPRTSLLLVEDPLKLYKLVIWYAMQISKEFYKRKIGA
jgi:hypothetical protein